MANRLKINRLLAKSKKISEIPLRDGLCAVQGANSSGKTSLIRIIDYLLGGENHFISEIKQSCHWVAADINLGTTRVLIERSVQDDKASIRICSLNDVGNRKSEALELRPSQIEDTILERLNIPKVRVFTESVRAHNVTFGSLWKMMCVEQKKGWSDIQGAQETAYSPRLKQFVFEILLNLDRVRQYEVGVQRAEIQKQVNLLTAEANNIESFLNYLPDIPSKSKLEQQAKELSERKQKLEAEIAGIKQDLSKKTQHAEPIRENRDRLRTMVEAVKNEIATIELRLQDIILSANDIKSQLEKNRQLHQARKVFADIPVGRCPRCLSELDGQSKVAQPEHCYVCGKPYRDASDENEAFVQNLHLLADEQKEIEHLQATYQNELREKQQELVKLSVDFDKISGELNHITGSAISPAMESFEENMRVLGDVNADLSKTSQSLRMWEACDKKQSRLAMLKQQALDLKLKLNELSTHTDDDQKKLKAFQQLVFGLLKRMGLRFVVVELNNDYIPVVDGKNYLADEGGSSEKVRIILAYYTALLELSLQYSTNFPGILIFDTPIQHELDPKDFKALCLYWKELEEKNPGKFQILVTGNYFPQEVDYAIEGRRYDRDKRKFTIDLD